MMTYRLYTVVLFALEVTEDCTGSKVAPMVLEGRLQRHLPLCLAISVDNFL